MSCPVMSLFFFNDTATTEIYTLSLHDALPIFFKEACRDSEYKAHYSFRNLFLYNFCPYPPSAGFRIGDHQDRKSTRLNSSHANISYAVFCLKKKKFTPPPVTLSLL